MSEPASPANPFAHVGASLDDEQVRNKLWNVFVESLGGPDVMHWLVLHFEEGWSYRQIAELAKAANESTIRSRMKKAVTLLNRHELLPPHWLDAKPRKRHGRPRDRRRNPALEAFDAQPMALEMPPFDPPPPDAGTRYSVARVRATNFAQPRRSYGGGVVGWIHRLLTSADAGKETMMRDWTDITVVLDRSGSMGAIRHEAIDSFNRFLRDQQRLGDNAGLTLVRFNNHEEVVYEDVPLPEAPPLTRPTFQPRGNTALLDAMGHTIDRTGRRLAALPEPQRPERVLFVVLTDGMENASRVFTRDQVFQRIREQREIYSWQFVFLAANQDAIATATSYGIDAGSALTFAATPEGIDAAMSQLSISTERYRLVRRGESGSYFR